MRIAGLIAALGCSACDLVFPLEFEDIVPHLPTSAEATGELDLVIPAGADVFTLDTTMPGIQGSFIVDLTRVRQELTEADVAVLRVRELRVEGKLLIAGERPLIIIAESITISGSIDASAIGTRPGAGGGRPDLDPTQADPGQGVVGTFIPSAMGSRTGGGGGGFAAGAAPGGRVDCPAPLDASAGGQEIGDEALTILQAGGAGGRGGSLCTSRIAPGGGGGGALQLSARESITIVAGASVLAGGGGGAGGLGGNACPADAGDSGGGGGGAGGAIYLDAPTITNLGRIAANGGGGGGGGDVALDGQPGKDAFDGVMPGKGGGGSGKGTIGGDGASIVGASNGVLGDCSVALRMSLDTGGGGGALGRIVFRTNVKVDPIGDVNPTPRELDRSPERP